MTSATLATLVVYAYSSFVSSWGAGPVLVKKFEAKCHCHINLVNAGNGGEMISRLKLEGAHPSEDVVLGIDENYLGKMKLIMNWSQKFSAFEKGPFAFVYDSNIVKNPPKSLDDLLKPEWKGQIVIEDPRFSTVGLGFLVWVVREKGNGAWDYFKQLKPQLKVISPSWDMAYGLFAKNQTKLVLSYWTSPAYHIQEEKKHNIKAAPFTGGHYMQTEYVTVVPETKNKVLAESFVKFILSREAQDEIPRKNYMYPTLSSAKLTPAFKELGAAKVLTAYSEKDIRDNLDNWLLKWREIF